jgi:hypothetical protein
LLINKKARANLDKSAMMLELGSGPTGDAGSKDWVLLDEGEMKGMNIVVNHTTGEVTLLSTRFSRDTDRWKVDMPSVESYPSLKVLDLHNCRYLRSLHSSLGCLSGLTSLDLTRCDRLESLPESLGRLKSLEEVNFSLLLSFSGFAESNVVLFFFADHID